jgi:hypothetical protein
MMKVKVTPVEKPLVFEHIEAREALVEDMLNAQRASGESEGIAFNMALAAEICTFDGQKKTFEDLRKMRASDFLSLQLELTIQGALGSKELLSSLQTLLASTTKQ